MAQDSIPDFEMPMYFEDAVGNKDTIWVGYDNDLDVAACYFPNAFSDEEILQPFDSTLEIRAVHSEDLWTTRQTVKRIIGPTSVPPGGGCPTSNCILIFVSAKHVPITISYDSAQLNSTLCHDNAILSPTWQVFLIPYWWEAEKFYCLATTDHIVDDFSFFYSNPLEQEFEVEGKGMQLLPGYFLIFRKDSYCQNLTSTADLSKQPASAKVFPNPGQFGFYLDLAGFNATTTVQIFDLQGIRVYHKKFSRGGPYWISSGSWPSGLYLGNVTSNSGAQMFQFLKL